MDMSDVIYIMALKLQIIDALDKHSQGITEETLGYIR